MRYFIFSLIIFILIFSNFALAQENEETSWPSKVKQEIKQEFKTEAKKFLSGLLERVKIRVLNPLKNKIQQGSNWLREKIYQIKDYLINYFKCLKEADPA